MKSSKILISFFVVAVLATHLNADFFIRRAVVLPSGAAEFSYYTQAGESVPLENITGRVVRHFPNSAAIMYERQYVNGVLNGTFRRFLENGSVVEEMNYINGRIEGIRKVFMPNGHYFEYAYVNGLLHGTSRRYDANNRLMEELEHAYGVLHGVTRRYFASGILRISQTFRNGVLDGATNIFDDRGRLIEQMTYQNGTRISQRSRHPSADAAGVQARQEHETGNIWDGPARLHTTEAARVLNEILLIHGRNFSGLLQTHYINGQLKHEGRFRNGRPQGFLKTFSIDGNIISKDRYTNGVLNGASKLFYSCGSVLAIYRYVNGRLNGQSLVFFRNGNIMREENYVNNMLHGPMRTFFEDGRVSFQAYFSMGVPIGQFRYYYPIELGGRLKHIIEFINGSITRSIRFAPDGITKFSHIH